jgi:site-specific DNA recombinase
LGRIVHNPIYKGDARFESSYGSVVRLTEALVDVDTWDRAQEKLLRNRNLALKNSKNVYLLKGLIRCQQCGRSYVGTVNKDLRRYRCNAGTSRATGGLIGRCSAKTLRADWLEAAVWQECRQFILNPGAALDEARARLRHQMTKAAGFEKKRRDTLEHLATKETERERVLTLYRRGRISDDEAERELDAIAHEAAQLREILESQRSQVALIEAQESFMIESATLMGRLRHELQDIEATNDVVRKREIIARYVRQIIVETRDIGPRRKEASVRIHLLLKPTPVAVDDATRSRSAVRAPSLEVEHSISAAIVSIQMKRPAPLATDGA